MDITTPTPWPWQGTASSRRLWRPQPACRCRQARRHYPLRPQARIVRCMETAVCACLAIPYSESMYLLRMKANLSLPFFPGHCQPWPSATQSTTTTTGTTTATATGECEPHGDHWNCPSGVPEPTDPPAHPGNPPNPPPAGECEPHGDHWRCPDGVSEPSGPPPATLATPGGSPHPPPSGGECEPHGGHWHCPAGVPESNTPPPKDTTSNPSSPSSSEQCEPHGDH